MPPLIRGSPRKTLRRYGGKLQTTNCRSRCCNGGVGNCLTLRRYNRCPIPPIYEVCVNQPDHVWMCDPVDGICADYTGSPSNPWGIKYLNACYTATDTVINTVDMPVGDVFLDPFDKGRTWFCSNGCGDGYCTACQLYYAAHPCPGQDSCPQIVYVPIELVGQECMGWSRDGCCYYVIRSQMYREADFQPGARIYGIRFGDGPLMPDFRCCECVPTCQATEPVQIDDCALGAIWSTLRCCCSVADYIMTVTWAYHWESNIIDDLIPGHGPPITSVEDSNGSCSITVQNGQLTSTPCLNPVLTRVTTYTDPDGTVRTTTEYVPDGFPSLTNLCGVGPSAGPSRILGQVRCPRGGPFDNRTPDGGGYIVDQAYSVTSCTQGTVRSRWREFASTQTSPRTSASIYVNVAVFYTGKCGGGCGQGGDPIPLVRAASAPKPHAVPRDQWPLWARLASALAKDGDKGIGDTIQRTIGPIGGDAFKAWYQKVVGEDCGCGDRAAWLSARYPYAPPESPP